MPHLQAAAAAGQAHLIRLYDDCLRKHGYHAAQVLLTANDFKSRTRYLNVRNTLHTLFEYKAVPIVNENDTVSVAEIKFGDNDQLAAMVTGLLTEPLLIILSVVDGLYDGDPKSPASKLIPLVDQWNDSLMGLAAPGRSLRGIGGMPSKLEAVRTATGVGESVIIANGTHPECDRRHPRRQRDRHALSREGQRPAGVEAMDRLHRPSQGTIHSRRGARRAVETQGKSLLAIGVTAVEGEFAKGEVVSLVDRAGEEFARGLSNYNAHDARAIAGKRTDEIIQALGSLPYAEVIHRDNLVVTT